MGRKEEYWRTLLKKGIKKESLKVEKRKYQQNLAEGKKDQTKNMKPGKEW